MDIDQYIHNRIQVREMRILCCRLMLRFARGGMPLRDWSGEGGAAIGKKKSSGAFCIKQQSGNSSAPKVPF
ncbi:uncharacterized protein Asalp_28240 [Aeromonas salmonicida subsp. pectinolytica 34mel]|uniref:Uncharacterized protein n=1 Tax=Aeromonas salmonicida subsp. pectinolytica 34mel TaxID=1324960 RepID=T0PI09_AERSA|nr:uncharacterized protein Asalp_28240 [Aeromonas salmonicida subsp. pectinolytica 34mel]EQC02376.1 hypothetical protein K931_20827 [Aeromonas salmonicida subsp. pectinolytica 34mel]